MMSEEEGFSKAVKENIERRVLNACAGKTHLSHDSGVVKTISTSNESLPFIMT